MARFKEMSFTPQRVIASKLGVKFNPFTLEVTFQGQRVGKFLKDKNGLVIEENGYVSKKIISKAQQLEHLRQI